MVNIVRYASASGRFMLPGILTLLLLLLSMVNFRLPGISEFMPFTVAMVVFYWALFVPRLMPKWFVFVLGILQDAAYGAPLGISSLIYLLLWWLVVSQRRYFVKETFVVLWAVFSVFALFITLLSWGIHSLFFDMPLPLGNMGLQWIFSVLFYPFLHMLCNAVHEHFLHL